MIYEINGKIYIKADNYYAEVEVVNNILTPVKNHNRIYDAVDKSKIKSYSSLEEYISSISKTKDFEKTEIKRKNKIL